MPYALRRREHPRRRVRRLYGVHSDQGWIDALGELRERAEPCVLVVVTDVSGSAPREPGARMLVAGGDLAYGTIGGGNLERVAIERATALLADPDALAHSADYPLAEAAGQCCGGSVTLFFEPYRWQTRTVAIFGAGHVGQALAGLAPWLKARVLLIDGREEHELRPRVPEARPYELRCVGAPEAELAELPPAALLVVMTHSHALDLELVAAALARGTFSYLGLIGSERKWQRFQKRLQQRGFTPEQLARVRCPLGVVRTSKDPSAIALSTATELVAHCSLPRTDLR
ncbi:MAG: xanthine dehydrogenase accessory protein XdhC [Planctomycetes bacterium]|nr:xanthine dehydrogenase accessory protein XdhC [Planctomycetota bacterium]